MPCKQCENGKYRFGDGNCKYETLAECEAAHQTYDIVELVIDDNNEAIAIDAISLVTNPAIEVNAVFFNKENNLTLAKIDEEKRMLVSPALIPYKQIYRYNADTDKHYYVYFTAETVRKSAEAFIKHHNTNNATIQHEYKVTGVSVIESWISESETKDKSNLYGYELPKGTWFVSMRIENDEVWQQIKSGELKGLSIEGYFVNAAEKMAKVGSMVVDNMDLPLYDNEEEALAVAKEMGCEGVHEHTLDGKTVYMPCADHDIISALSEILNLDCDCLDTELITPNPCQSGYEPYGHKIKDGKKVPNCVPIKAKKKSKLESYTDYPQAATNNAKRAIKWKEENGTTCGTRVGWTRARQLADRKPISRDTIARMASFKRHQQNKDVPYSEGCGGLMWDAWGGSSGVNWAISKLKEIDSENKTNE